MGVLFHYNEFSQQLFESATAKMLSSYNDTGLKEELRCEDQIFSKLFAPTPATPECNGENVT